MHRTRCLHTISNGKYKQIQKEDESRARKKMKKKKKEANDRMNKG